MPNAIFYETKLNELVGDPTSAGYQVVKGVVADGTLDLLSLFALGRQTGLIDLDDELWSETFTILHDMPDSMGRRVMDTLRDATSRDLPVRVRLSRPIVPGSIDRGTGVVIIDLELPMSDPDPADITAAKTQ